MEQTKQEILVEEEFEGQRLDAFLAQRLVEQYSRSKIKKMIESGNIRVEGREVSAHYAIKPGERIDILDAATETEETRAEDIPLNIVYEDDDLILVDKPAGIVVHPAHGNLNHTLVNALLFHTKKLSSGGATTRPGIVHRLDKDTSGILVVAKNDVTHAALGKQFKDHSIERTYFTVVKGVVQHDEGFCDEPVGRAFLSRKKIIVKPSGGKQALTKFKVEKRFARNTLLRVHPQTGRTHQIRVHMAYTGHPVVGDSLYGVKSPWIGRQALHAGALGFTHPTTKERVYFESPLPEDMKFLISKLEQES